MQEYLKSFKSKSMKDLHWLCRDLEVCTYLLIQNIQ